MLSFKGRVRAAIIGLLYLAGGSIATGGTLLPPGEQTFFDNNGLPLSAGCVYFFVPGTMSPKATYQNSAQTIANTNPVQLDAAGRAIIYGTGTYRQIVRASNGTITPCSPAGTQIWDQLTASTDSSATIFAGASAGTPNAITVTAPGFSGADGQVINYVSTNTNTGSATFSPSGFGAAQIVRDSSIGPQPLTGGELVATNAVSLIYDATAGTFHILSPVTWPNTSGIPVGAVIPVAGFNAPTNFAFSYGQAVSRTTYSALFGALTSAQTVSLTNGSPTITGLSDLSQFGNFPVEGVGIPPGASIISCAGTSCNMSVNATVTRTGTVTLFAYPNGDGSTTFNLPDYRGVAMVGRTNMGGTTKSNLSLGNFGISPTTLGALGGTDSKVLTLTNLPPFTPVGTVTNGAITVNGGGAVVAGGIFSDITPGSVQGVGAAATITASQGATTFTGTPQPGANSTPVSAMPPGAIVNYAIRLVP